MTVRKLFLALSAALFFVACVHTGHSAGNGAPRITYDNHCFTIDGRDTFIYSGAFHYTRCPKPLWRDRFRKMKEAGLNTVETYVPWNYHEREMPGSPDDFSKMTALDDLADFLKIAQEEFGFYTIVRPGPYICAEWDGGGFPRWLLLKRPAGKRENLWLRSDDPEFLKWSAHWIKAIASVVAPFQISRVPAGHPGVILWQLENEYDFVQQPEKVKQHLIEALAHMARENGIDVPLFTCMTRGSNFRDVPFIRDNVIETNNFYPGYDVGAIRRGDSSLTAYQPGLLHAISEFQGGWFTSVGKVDSDPPLDAAQINHITVQALELGVSSINYYMFFGGTNLAGWASRTLTTSYDYNAPIREWGAVGERYAAVKSIGTMLQQHGPALARSSMPGVEILQKTHPDVSVRVRRAKDGGAYIFVRSERRDSSRVGYVVLRESDPSGVNGRFDYILAPFGAKILYVPLGERNPARGEWLLRQAALPARPATIPAPVTIKTALVRADADPREWKNITPGQTLADLGIFDTRFAAYRGKIRVTPAQLAKHPSLGLVLASRDQTVLRLNGHVLFPGFTFPDPITAVFNVNGILKEGENSLEVLYENGGHFHGGTELENMKGVTGICLLPGEELTRDITGWKMLLVDTDHDRPEIASDFDDSQWQNISVETEQPEIFGKGKIAVYRAPLSVSQQDLDNGMTTIVFGGIDDDGWVYVNGKKAGEAHNWDIPQVFCLKDLLHPGTNSIAVVVSNAGGNEGGISKKVRLQLTLDPVAAAPKITQWQMALQPAGDRGEWWKPSLKADGWKEVSLPASPRDASLKDSLLTWYRVSFDLPSADPSVWIPWRATLHGAGNGIIYLNGHPLGRFWEAGPQYDFFLPECWLNFGPGKTNVLTLNLRAGEKGAMLHPVSVSPYPEGAEQR